MNQLYIYGGAVVLLWLLERTRRTPTASVDLEEPTVSGSGSDDYGGSDYATTPRVLVPDVRLLVNQAAARIAAHDAENPDGPESGDYGTIE